MLRPLSVAVVLATMQAPQEAATAGGWELRAKEVQRHGNSWADTLTSAGQGQQVRRAAMTDCFGIGRCQGRGSTVLAFVLALTSTELQSSPREHPGLRPLASSGSCGQNSRGSPIACHGYINKDGEWQIPRKFDSAREFTPEGLAAARPAEGGLWGYISTTGDWVIPPQFTRAGLFSNGFALVSKADWPRTTISIAGGIDAVEFPYSAFPFADLSFKWGGAAYIDKTGRPLEIEPLVVAGSSKPAEGELFFAGKITGLMPVEGLIAVRFGKNVGYVNTQGRVTIPPSFERAAPFSEGLAAVKVDGKWGYIDTQGSIVIRPQFNEAREFAGGLAAVRAGALKGWNFIDKTGKPICQDTSRDVGDFSEGLAAFEKGWQSPKFGYIDSSCRMVVEPQFGLAHSFSEGLAFVGITSSINRFVASKWLIIDRSGNRVVELPRFGRRVVHQLGPFIAGLARVHVDEEVYYIDTSGTRIQPK